MTANDYKFKLLATCALLFSGYIASMGQGVAFDWVRQLEGDADYGSAHALATDKSGNVYVTGGFGGTVDFDPGPGTNPFTANGFADVFVMKLDAAGSVIWARQMGGSSQSDRGRSIAVDDSGNVFTAGIFYETADFDPDDIGTAFLNAASPGWSDVFISKLDVNGDYVWAKSIGGIEPDDVSTIKVDAAGNVYIYGSFSSTVDFDPGQGVHPLTAASPAGFLLKLDASGAFVWVKQFSGAGMLLPTSMTLAPSGNIYLLGNMMGGAVDFDPGTGNVSISPAGLMDFCVLRLDSSGNLVWVKHISGTSPFSMGMATALAIDSQEQVFTTGILMLDALDFNPGSPAFGLSPTGASDIFISKLDSAGNFLWAKASSGSPGATSETYSLATDTRGNVYASGYYSDTIDLSTGTPSARLGAAYAGIHEAMLVKFRGDGAFAWARAFRSTDHASANAVAVDLQGSVLSAGYFADSCDFDPGSAIFDQYADGGTADIFIHKMICTDTTSSVLNITAECDGYVFGDTLYTHNGVYTRVTTNAAGCDSTITLQLTITPLEAVINVNGFVLGTTAHFETYQWLLDGLPIPNATDSSYTVMENGHYQVVVTNNKGCSDTSDAYEVKNYTGITNPLALADKIRVYPNPAQDIIFIQAPFQVNVTLTDLSGRVLPGVQKDNSLLLNGYSDGVYFLRITDDKGQLLKVAKVIKSKS